MRFLLIVKIDVNDAPAKVGPRLGETRFKTYVSLLISTAPQTTFSTAVTGFGPIHMEFF